MAEVHLTAFLDRAAGEPFRYGDWDCSMFVANWVELRTGQDPASALRGRYRTRLGWMRIVRKSGGLVALVERLALGVGLLPTTEPGVGDIGVVETSNIGPACGIRIGRGWAVKLGDGMSAAALPMMAAWRFPG